MSRRDELELAVIRARRSRAHRRKRASRRRRLGALFAVLGVIVAIGLVAVGFGGAIAYHEGCSVSSLHPYQLGQNTFVYAADGSRLGSIPAEGRNRQKVTWRQISPWMPKATVAVEDKRYWQHGGVDYVGIARAAWRDVTAGKAVEGGSTITQQLVRNLYISKERTFKRKLKEVCLAIKLSRRWSKDRILNEYLNQVYYGNHAYGIEAAAQTYYSEHAYQLGLGQAALLAGLPQARQSIVFPADVAAAVRRRPQTGQGKRTFASGAAGAAPPADLPHRGQAPGFACAS